MTAALLALVLSAALLVGPGAVAAAMLRVGLAPAVSIGAAGMIGGVSVVAILASLARVPFGVWVVLPILAVAVAIILLARRRLPSGAVGERRLPFVLAWLTAALVIVAVVGPPLAAPGAFSQTYDGVFHLNAVARILDTGDASSFTLYRLNNPGDDIEFYPGGWHALVAIVTQASGATIPQATSAVWIAVAIAVWVPGIAWLAGVLAPTARRASAAVTAAVLAAGFAGFPYLLLDWGTLYPTGLAYALLPAGLALIARVLGVTADGVRGGRLHWLLLGVWGSAAVFAHPRSMFSLAVLVAPMLAVVAGRWLRRIARGPGGVRRAVLVASTGVVLLVVAGTVAAIGVLRYFGADQRPISDRLNGGPARANQSLLDTVLQVLGQAPVVSPAETALPPAIGLALLVLAGFVVAAGTRGIRWLPVSFLLMAVLYCAAAASDSDLAKVLTGAWYKDKYRLASVLPMLAIPAASLAVAGLLEWLRTRMPWARARVVVIAAGAVLVAVSTVPSLLAIQRALGEVIRMSQVKDGAAVDADELRLMERLPELVPEGDLVIGNPWDGSALTWALGRRESVFPHLTGIWGPDRDVLATRLADAQHDPAVCDALERLGVGYLFDSDGLLWGAGGAGIEYYAGIDRAAGAPGFTEIAREGSSALYRIDACD